jgi:hypothetical protein
MNLKNILFQYYNFFGWNLYDRDDVPIVFLVGFFLLLVGVGFIGCHFCERKITTYEKKIGIGCFSTFILVFPFLPVLVLFVLKVCLYLLPFILLFFSCRYCFWPAIKWLKYKVFGKFPSNHKIENGPYK